MNGQLRRRVVVVAMVLVLVVPVGVSLTAVSAQSVTEIGSCTTITESGEYRLTGDIGTNASGGVCLDVTASDVTIDGNGYTISGDGSRTGIELAVESATVRDVTLTNWEYGLSGSGGSAVTLASIDAVDNGQGVYYELVDRLVVTDSTLANNDDNGMGLQSMTSVEVRGTLVSRNADDGVVTDGVNDVFITESQFRNNDVGLLVNLDSATVERSLFTGNRIGAGFLESTGTLRYNVFDGNDGAGVNAEETGTVDARENWWGAESGPAGGVEDPATGAIANGAGDEVFTLLGDIRFDPYYVTDPREGDGVLSNEVRAGTQTPEPTDEPPETERPETETPDDGPTTTQQQPTVEPTTQRPTERTTTQQRTEPPATEIPEQTEEPPATETPRDTQTPDDGDEESTADGPEAGDGGDTSSTDGGTDRSDGGAGERDGGADDGAAGDSEDESSSEPGDDRSEGAGQSANGEEQSTESGDASDQATATPAVTATATPTSTQTPVPTTDGTTAAAGPSAPLNGTRTPASSDERPTARVIGGEESTTSSGFGPGFGVVAALFALVAAALLAGRRQ